MPDKSWKAFERRVAGRVGGKRIPVTGERDGSVTRKARRGRIRRALIPFSGLTLVGRTPGGLS